MPSLLDNDFEVEFIDSNNIEDRQTEEQICDNETNNINNLYENREGDDDYID